MAITRWPQPVPQVEIDESVHRCRIKSGRLGQQLNSPGVVADRGEGKLSKRPVQKHPASDRHFDVGRLPRSEFRKAALQPGRPIGPLEPVGNDLRSILRVTIGRRFR